MNNTILDIAIIFSGIIGYFISISLVTISFYKNRANTYLSVSLFLITSLTILGWFDIENTVLGFLNNPILEYLFGVTLFTYFLIQIKHKYLKKTWYKWLYLPFVVVLIIEIVFSHYDTVYSDIAFDVTDNASFLFNAFLIFWGRKLIKGASPISKDKKRWLLRLNLFIIIIIIIWLLSNIEIYIFDSEYATGFMWIGLSFLSWWMLYYGVFKLQLIVQKEEIHAYLISKKFNSNTQAKKKIDQHTVSKITTQLYQLMDEHKLYKDPLLSRLDLANRLEISEGYLSKIINQDLNKSIIQFINEYRIETAKYLLHDPVFNRYSIEAIGMEAGFKSKSAFYKTFNTSLGMSPGAYRKLQKSPDS